MEPLSLLLSFFALILIIHLLIIGFAFLLGFKLVKAINIVPEQSMVNFVILMTIVSIIYFLLTLVIYLAFKAMHKEKIFVRFFELTYLIYFYLSGLVTLIGVLKQCLLSENIFNVSDFLSEDIVIIPGVSMIFFIVIMNYAFFKRLILKRKIF